MTKYCYNYDSGEYEYIDKDGYSETQGEYLSCCKHNAEAEKHILLPSEQSEIQKRHLHKCRYAQRNHLTHPLYKPFGIAFGNAELKSSLFYASVPFSFHRALSLWSSTMRR